MPKFVIEREMPGVGALPAEQLQALTDRTRAVASGPDGNVQWLYSFIADDKTYCVYLASDADVLRECAERLGMPVTRVSQIRSIIEREEEEGITGS